VHFRDRNQVVRSAAPRDIDGRRVTNKILAAIPDGEYRSVRTHLEFVELLHHSILHEPGQKLEFAYFPNAGLISLVVAMENGKTVEVGVVGNEGAAGIPSAVSLMRSPLREMVQITGDGFRIKVGTLQRLLKTATGFQMILSRYAVIQGMQVAQTAACNRLHDVEQRLARWLLMAQDRVDAAFLPITHDFLATMLGTDRPSVSLAAGILQRKKYIEYTRGAVKILNRRKLEGSACECYGAIRDFNTGIGLP
jgi:CRP-like cAMP-binding protein